MGSCVTRVLCEYSDNLNSRFFAETTPSLDRFGVTLIDRIFLVFAMIPYTKFRSCYFGSRQRGKWDCAHRSTSTVHVCVCVCLCADIIRQLCVVVFYWLRFVELDLRPISL